MGRRVFLCFEGVASAFHIWVNGVAVGYSQDSRLPAEFDITEAMAAAAGSCMHTLSLTVYRLCDGIYLEDQDMWWLSGIHRDVLLYSKPAEVHISDYHVTTSVVSTHSGVPPAQLRGAVVLNVTVKLQGMGIAWPTYCDVVATLLGPCMLQQDIKMVPLGGREMLEAVNVQQLQPTVVREGGWVASTSMTIEDAVLWTAESPWLYTLVVSLRRSGRCVDCEKCRVGMRSVRIEGNKLCVNGAAIEIRGVNRHEHDDRLGKYTDRASMLQDLMLMKKLNINSVRTSHYPNRLLFCVLCDAFGMYVCDEANLETQGLVVESSERRLANDTSWETAFLQRIRGLVMRDRNHACVIMWSLGNEASYGKNHDVMAAWTRATDPTRPIHYEPCGGGTATDIIAPMYPSPQKLLSLANLPNQNQRSIEIGRSWPAADCSHARPVIMCEYAHAMGNSSGNLDEYWHVVRTTDGIQVCLPPAWTVPSVHLTRQHCTSFLLA